MKMGNKPPNMSKKGAVVGMVVCFVAMIAVASVYTSGRMKRMKDQIAKEEAQTQATSGEDVKNPTKDTDSADDQDPSTAKGSDQDSEQSGQSKKAALSDGASAGNGAVENAATSDEASKEASGGAKAVAFATTDEMKWPLSGGVILGYSMDRTVYFKTLDQYKCNPAILIDGEPGSDVVAAVDGNVVSVSDNSETGTTMVVDIGNGYRAIYGQLADVKYSKGQYMAEGTTIGKLAEPSIYYTEEGPNLFFEVTKDGVPVDPMGFLQ